MVRCVAARRAGAGHNSPRDARADPRRAKQAPLTRRPRRSAAAVHITCRFASTTVTNPRANADTLPNANPSAMTATRPSSRVAALFIPSQHDRFLPGRVTGSGWLYVQHRGGLPTRCSMTTSSASWTSGVMGSTSASAMSGHRPCRTHADGPPEPPASEDSTRNRN